MKRKRNLFLLLGAALLSACSLSNIAPSVSSSDSTITSSSSVFSSISNPSTSTSASSTPSPASSSSTPGSSFSSSNASSIGGSDEATAYFSKIDFSKTGNALRGDLASLLNAKAYSSPSYETLKTTLPKCDLDPDGSGYMVGFYNRKKLKPAWDGAVTWNREHVWPNSRGVGESGPGSDPHMIRPADVSLNSSRRNMFYGLSSDGSCYDPGSEGFPEYRGIAARIIFYVATRYWKTNGLELSNNPGDDTSKKTMGKLSRLLEWNQTYPVDATETYRNKVLAGLYNVRNPFIDFPSLATTIYGA